MASMAGRSVRDEDDTKSIPAKSQSNGEGARRPSPSTAEPDLTPVGRTQVFPRYRCHFPAPHPYLLPLRDLPSSHPRVLPVELPNYHGRIEIRRHDRFPTCDPLCRSGRKRCSRKGCRECAGWRGVGGVHQDHDAGGAAADEFRAGASGHAAMMAWVVCRSVSQLVM